MKSSFYKKVFATNSKGESVQTGQAGRLGPQLVGPTEWDADKASGFASKKARFRDRLSTGAASAVAAAAITAVVAGGVSTQAADGVAPADTRKGQVEWVLAPDGKDRWCYVYDDGTRYECLTQNNTTLLFDVVLPEP